MPELSERAAESNHGTSANDMGLDIRGQRRFYRNTSCDYHVATVGVIFEGGQCGSQEPHVSFDVDCKALVLHVNLIGQDIPKTPLESLNLQKDRILSILQLTIPKLLNYQRLTE